MRRMSTASVDEIIVKRTIILRDVTRTVCMLYVSQQCSVSVDIQAAISTDILEIYVDIISHFPHDTVLRFPP